MIDNVANKEVRTRHNIIYFDHNGLIVMPLLDLDSVSEFSESCVVVTELDVVTI